MADTAHIESPWSVLEKHRRDIYDNEMNFVASATKKKKAAHIVKCVNERDTLIAENKRLREDLEGVVKATKRSGSSASKIGFIRTMATAALSNKGGE